mgnify:CR=1 FL=1
MRGKVFVGCQVFFLSGITPAYAGKSSEDSGGVKYTMDHPRLCGEKNDQAVRVGLYQGSPPPMRGKEYAPHSCRWYSRITPAYAGKRRFVCKEIDRI